MAFFNMQKGDVPLFKALSDRYTISDNYHQPVLGGTGPDSVPLGFADQVFVSDSKGNAVNVNPGWTPQGTPTPGAPIPPLTMRSIGDVLSEKNIPWKYYGGGYNVSGTGTPLDGTYCNICNPFEYQVNYPAMRADHMRDVTDLFTDLANGTLPAVSYVKPDGLMDGHPASSKFDLFEAFVQNILTLAQSNKEQWKETAIFITVDEGGGYYDSGFIQPVDFFETGPRIPMIAVSPFSTGGRVSHVYNEHSSFVKFVERNWKLHTKLSARSRDNLPNPRMDDDNLYVPVNMPAIGDLFDMFDFGDVDHDDDRRDNDHHDDDHHDGDHHGDDK
jgi:phospholipase C